MDWKDTLGSLLASGSLPEDGREETATSPEPAPAKDIAPKPILNVVFERKGRGGKSATIIEGFGDMEESEIAALAARLKGKLGIGGSARGGEILLQGDQRTSRLKDLLATEGFKTKGLK